MKRKYYLRGLGIGILVTALVFIMASPSGLSDEEVIKRAEELGYVKLEEGATPSIGIKNLLETGTPIPQPTATIPPTSTPMPTPTPEPALTPTNSPVPQPAETIIPTEVPTPTIIPTPTVEPEQSAVSATIIVEHGNTATAVCTKIETAGIIKNGDDLKKYLINNNLTNDINVGTYTLSSDMSLEEIAKILTGR